jgi:hypothetical protein
MEVAWRITSRSVAWIRLGADQSWTPILIKLWRTGSRSASMKVSSDDQLSCDLHGTHQIDLRRPDTRRSGLRSPRSGHCRSILRICLPTTWRRPRYLQPGGTGWEHSLFVKSKEFFFNLSDTGEKEEEYFGCRRVNLRVIHCTSRMITTIPASDKAVTDKAPHFVFVTREVGAGAADWDPERHEAQIVEMVDVERG